MPVRFTHADALQTERIHRLVLQCGPSVTARHDRRADWRREERWTRLDGEFQGIRIRGLLWHQRRSVGAANLDVDRRAGDAGNLSDREPPSVPEHRGIEATGESRDAEILGHFMGKGDEELRRLVDDIFDGVQRSAWREEHLPLGDDELRMLIAAGKNGDERFSLEAVAEFVSV